MAERTWAWAAEMAARGAVEGILAPEGFRAPTVTCVRLAGGRTGTEVAAAMKARGFVVGAGYGKLKDATFRIGHMGEVRESDLEALLAEIDSILEGLAS